MTDAGSIPLSRNSFRYAGTVSAVRWNRSSTQPADVGSLGAKKSSSAWRTRVCLLVSMEPSVTS